MQDPRKKVRLIFLCALGAVLLLIGVWQYMVHTTPKRQVVSFSVNQDSHAARSFGTDSARVDSQITLSIPPDQVDAVYEYLWETYGGKDHLLQTTFPNIRLSGQPQTDISIFTDQYFDTPHLDLYYNQNSARYRFRVNTTNPDDRKSGRELVQVKATPPGAFDLRTELKYEVKANKTKYEGVDDRHPLIRLIKNAQREDFKKAFTEATIDPYSLRHIFTIVQERRRIYLNWDTQNFLSFSVDRGGGNFLWARGSFASVDLGLVEIAYTEADETKRKSMWEIREAILKDLQEKFPDLSINSESKYAIVLKQLIEQIPFLPTLVKYRLYNFR
jgi:hypothetical protein